MVRCSELMMKQTLKTFFSFILRYRCFSKMKKTGHTRFLELWCDGKADKPCFYCPYFIGNCSLLTNSAENAQKQENIIHENFN